MGMKRLHVLLLFIAVFLLYVPVVSVTNTFFGVFTIDDVFKSAHFISYPISIGIFLFFVLWIIDNADNLFETREKMTVWMAKRSDESWKKNKRKKNEDKRDGERSSVVKIPKGSNFAYAKFTIGDVTRLYAANSKEGSGEAVCFELSDKSTVKICNSIDLVNTHLPVKRLSCDMGFHIPNESLYASKKVNCCERKILAQIIDDFKDQDLKGSELLIYTSMEPCIYCFNALTEFQSAGVTVSLYYDDMLRNMAGKLSVTEISRLVS